MLDFSMSVTLMKLSYFLPFLFYSIMVYYTGTAGIPKWLKGVFPQGDTGRLVRCRGSNPLFLRHKTEASVITDAFFYFIILRRERIILRFASSNAA